MRLLLLFLCLVSAQAHPAIDAASGGNDPELFVVVFDTVSGETLLQGLGIRANSYNFANPFSATINTSSMVSDPSQRRYAILSGDLAVDYLGLLYTAPVGFSASVFPLPGGASFGAVQQLVFGEVGRLVGHPDHVLGGTGIATLSYAFQGQYSGTLFDSSSGIVIDTSAPTGTTLAFFRSNADAFSGDVDTGELIPGGIWSFDGTALSFSAGPPCGPIDLIVDAGGPYSVVDGADLELQGSAFDASGSIVTALDWDLDNDGTFEFSGGLGPTQTAPPAAYAGLPRDVPLTVRLRASNANGCLASAGSTLVISTVASEPIAVPMPWVSLVAVALGSVRLQGVLV